MSEPEHTTTTLAAAYLRHSRTHAEADAWAVDEVTDCLLLGRDADAAWSLVLALVSTADADWIGFVGAGPLEDFVKRFAPERIAEIERQASVDPKFRACLGCVWLEPGDLPDAVLERVITASDHRIKPLGFR